MGQAKTIKLIMVGVDIQKGASQSNKYYHMIHDGTSSQFTVEYGRVEKTKQTETYPLEMWDKKYREKTKKGYKDVTHLFAEVVTSTATNGTTTQSFTDITNAQVKQLIDTLQSYANKTIKQNYTVSAENVTQKQVDEAQICLDNITRSVKIGAKKDTVNKHLLELYMIVPRQMANVKYHLLQNDILTQNDLKEAQKKIADEQATLDVMAGQVAQIKAKKNAGLVSDKDVKKTLSILDVLGLEITPVTDAKEIEMIKDKMNDLKRKGQQDNRKIFKQAFKIINKKTQAAFDANLKIATNKKCELLWHGSRNANYLSIAEKGLLIRPAGAGYNGSMWGDGIYFGLHSGKSLNYTDYRGSYRSYTGGSDSKAFLALFNVHVGDPLHKYKHDSDCYTISKQVKKENKDCCWAHAGASIVYDEIIVYSSNKCTIQYLIEVEG